MLQQGTWVWCPNKRKAYLRGHLYLSEVAFAGIPNQSILVQDAFPQTKGDATYPHSSIVKVIERHVELETDAMEADNAISPISQQPIILPAVAPATEVIVPTMP